MCLIFLFGAIVYAQVDIDEIDFNIIDGKIQKNAFLKAYKECNGMYKGKKLTQKELEIVLKRHMEWQNVYRDDISEKYTLFGIVDSKTVPPKSKEAKQDPRRANLCGADLRGIELIDLYSPKQNLMLAIFSGAKLDGAHLQGWFHYSDFAGASLTGANLSRAHLYDSNFKAANLNGADMSDAQLGRTNFEMASLQDSNLYDASLSVANFQDAILHRANLSSALIDNTNFNNAEMNWAHFDQPTFFEPKHLPEIGSISQAKGLWLLYFRSNPEQLVALREGMKRIGNRDKERQITYAIKNSEIDNLQRHAWEVVDDGFGGLLTFISEMIEAKFNWLLFNSTTMWGLHPSRAILMIFEFIPLFAVIYFIALIKSGCHGIWKQWDKDRLPPEIGTDEPIRLLLKGRKAILVAMYFSLLSAFRIGWREFNVGNWISRIQQNQYVLVGSGWIRTVSGIQSLVSVYLLAIWVLTYFGRPFE